MFFTPRRRWAGRRTCSARRRRSCRSRTTSANRSTWCGSASGPRSMPNSSRSSRWHPQNARYEVCPRTNRLKKSQVNNTVGVVDLAPRVGVVNPAVKFAKPEKTGVRGQTTFISSHNEPVVLGLSFCLVFRFQTTDPDVASKAA